MALDDLLAHLKQTAALSQAAGILSWDQEAMMPAKGAASGRSRSAPWPRSSTPATPIRVSPT